MLRPNSGVKAVGSGADGGPLGDSGDNDGASPGRRSGCDRFLKVNLLGASAGEVSIPAFAGTGRLSALARATAMDEALGNRAAGSLARLRIMTSVRAGGIFELMRSGEVGIVLICCTKIETTLSPLNGRTPVQIS